MPSQFWVTIFKQIVDHRSWSDYVWLNFPPAQLWISPNAKMGSVRSCCSSRSARSPGANRKTAQRAKELGLLRWIETLKFDFVEELLWFRHYPWCCEMWNAVFCPWFITFAVFYIRSPSKSLIKVNGMMGIVAPCIVGFSMFFGGRVAVSCCICCFIIYEYIYMIIPFCWNMQLVCLQRSAKNMTITCSISMNVFQIIYTYIQYDA